MVRRTFISYPNGDVRVSYADTRPNSAGKSWQRVISEQVGSLARLARKVSIRPFKWATRKANR